MKNMKANADDKVEYNSKGCMGCGLCVTTCPSKALILERKPDDQLTFAQDREILRYVRADGPGDESPSTARESRCATGE